ncbi:hypothetical protein ACFYUJ_38855 [Streptomyces sp. NPDC004520]|uniref:hypothetical protein n=1 Tax=Streptomyces sp. NPDC004520 TaxID=3364702 RepID=UPI0036ACAC12
MSTPRRRLGYGPQPQPQQPAAAPPADGGSARRVRAVEADVETASLYRPGGLEQLARLRERGVLGPTQSPA